MHVANVCLCLFDLIITQDRKKRNKNILTSFANMNTDRTEEVEGGITLYCCHKMMKCQRYQMS